MNYQALKQLPSAHPAKQQGLSLWGFLFGAAFICVGAMLFIKLMPMYMEQYQVDSALAGLEAEAGWGDKTNREIRAKIGKFLNINQVDNVKDEHVLIKRGDGKTLVTIQYERREPLVHVLDVVAKYNKTVTLKANN